MRHLIYLSPVLLVSYLVKATVVTSVGEFLVNVLGPGLLMLAVMQIIRQNWHTQGEVPLYGGWIPYLGHALSFGQNYALLLARLAEETKAFPGFTIFIAGNKNITEPQNKL